MGVNRLKQAAEEAGWLVARGYAAASAAEFVSQHRMLDDKERALLDCHTRLSARYTHHIARELEPEDVSRRPLRVDASSVLWTLAAARRGDLLVVSPAGVVCDPTWLREAPLSEVPDSVLDQAVAALRALRPSKVRWFVDEGLSSSDTLAERLVQRSEKKLPMQVKRVADVAACLTASTSLVSSDPLLLDDCRTWLNLVGKLVRELSAKTVSLDV